MVAEPSIRGPVRVNMKPTHCCSAFPAAADDEGLGANNKGASIASATLHPLRAANTEKCHPQPTQGRARSELVRIFRDAFPAHDVMLCELGIYCRLCMLSLPWHSPSLTQTDFEINCRRIFNSEHRPLRRRGLSWGQHLSFI